MPISDLTGTTWVFSYGEDVNQIAESGILGTLWNITFSSSYYNDTFTGFGGLDEEMIGYYKNGVANEWVYDIGAWEFVSEDTITITGGTDATNADLIAAIQFAATQPSSQLSVDLSTLSGWSDVTAGSHTLTIKAKATGYRDSNASAGAGFTKAASGYNVRVQGEIDTAGSVTIYDGMTSSAPSLVDYKLLYNFTFDETVLCTSGYLYVDAYGCEGCYIGNGSGGVAKTGSYFTVTGDGSITGIYAYGCFVEGTEITLADGSTKKIEDITFDDDLLVYDFYEGKFSTAKPRWVSEAKTMDNYLRVSFNNGSELKVIGPGGDIGYHRIFNVEAQSFTHTGTQECQAGTTAFTDKGEFTKIVSQEVVKEDVRFFNVITDKHYNLFANGILTSCKLSNRYEIKDMKYTDKKLMTEQEVNEYINTLPYKGFKTEETQKG